VHHGRLAPNGTRSQSSTGLGLDGDPSAGPRSKAGNAPGGVSDSDDQSDGLGTRGGASALMTSLAIVVGLWVVVGLAAAVSALRRRANDTKRIERFQRALWINEARADRDDPREPEPAPADRRGARGVKILGPRGHAARPGATAGPASDLPPAAGCGQSEPAEEPKAASPAAEAQASQGPAPAHSPAECRPSAEAVPFPRARIPEGTRRHFGGAGRGRPRLAHLGRVAGEQPVELPAAAQLEAEAARRAEEEGAGSGLEAERELGTLEVSEGSDAPEARPAPPADPAGQDDGDDGAGSGTAKDEAGVRPGVHAAATLEEPPADLDPELAGADPVLAGTVSWLPEAVADARERSGPGRLPAPIATSSWASFTGHRHRPRRLALLGAIATVVVVAVGASVALSEASGSSTLTAPRKTSRSGSSATGRAGGSRGSGGSGARSGAPTTTTTTAPPKPSVVQPVSSDAVQASYVTPSAPFDLTLTTSGPCWIDLVNRTSGAVLYTGTMTAGESKSFSDLDQIYLRAGRMKNLQITVDGIPVDSPNNGPGAYDLVFRVPSRSSGGSSSGSTGASSGTPA
jgi:hypothetical protein